MVKYCMGVLDMSEGKKSFLADLQLLILVPQNTGRKFFFTAVEEYRTPDIFLMSLACSFHLILLSYPKIFVICTDT